MSAYLIVDIEVHDTERYAEYVKQVPKFIEKHEGKYLVRGGATEVKEGTWTPNRLVVLEFPSRAHAESFLDDPGYAPVAAIRHAAATTRLVLAEGF